MHNKKGYKDSHLLTLSMCGCVWWAVGWAAPQAAEVSSPSPKPDCPPSGRGRRAARGFGGRWGADAGLLARRHQGLTSWVVTGWDFFSVLGPSDSAQGRRGRRVTPPAWQECVWGWGDVMVAGVEQQYPGIKEEERKGKMAERERERFY